MKIQQIDMIKSKVTQLTTLQKISYVIGLIVLFPIVNYISRELNISAQYKMSNAKTRGIFAQSTMMGQAMQSYPQYRANLIQDQKQEQMAQTFSTWAIGGDIIKEAGIVIGGLVCFPLALGTNGLSILGGASVGYAISSKLADSIVNYGASFSNAKISQQGDLKSAEEQRNAIIRTNMWTSPLARFNNRKGADTQGFMDRYGKDPNALGIQTIASNMNVPFNTQDLKSVANNFLQAGFSVDQFAKLTLQATQYQVVTGKNLQAFSEDMMKARAKYYGAYDLNTNQIAIDLMTRGVQPEDAQKLAYQSQFNSLILQKVAHYFENIKT